MTRKARPAESRFDDEALERMLTGWQAWKLETGPNGLGYGRSTLDPAKLERAGTDRRGMLGPPLAAFDLERAVAALPARMRNALALEYLSPSLTQTTKAEALGLASRQAYVRAVDEAKRRLAARVRSMRRARARRVIHVKHG